MQQKTLVGFFTEDLEAPEQEAVCTPEFGNGRMFYYYMKEGTSNASAGVGWRIYLGRIIEKAVITNYSYLAKNAVSIIMQRDENACNDPFNPGNSRVIKSTERQV